MSIFGAEKQVVILPASRDRSVSKLGWFGPDGALRQRRLNLSFPYANFDSARSHAVSDTWVVGLRPGTWMRPEPSFLYRARLTWANGQPQLAALPEIRISAWQQVHALLLVGDWLYVGGSAAKTWLWPYENDEYMEPDEPRPTQVEYLVRYDLTAPDPQPEAVPLPVAFGPGKAIDDLLRLGDELLVVDDIVYPKYLFFYQLQLSPALPQWRKTHQLPFARTYEHIQGGEWNAEFIVLLSRSGGRSGSSRYVSVLRRPDLKPVLLLNTFWNVRYRRAHDEPESNKWAIEAVALQGPILLVACGSRGLARVLLQRETLWPKRRISYQYTTFSGVAAEETKWHRSRETTLNEPLDLAETSLADGVEWLVLAPGGRSVERVCFVGPGRVLLSGKGQNGCQIAWLETLPAV